MEGLKIQSVVRPDKPMSFNEKSTHILNEVLKSKGLKPVND